MCLVVGFSARRSWDATSRYCFGAPRRNRSQNAHSHWSAAILAFKVRFGVDNSHLASPVERRATDRSIAETALALVSSADAFLWLGDRMLFVYGVPPLVAHGRGLRRTACGGLSAFFASDIIGAGLRHDRPDSTLAGSSSRFDALIDRRRPPTNLTAQAKQTELDLERVYPTRKLFIAENILSQSSRTYQDAEVQPGL